MSYSEEQRLRVAVIFRQHTNTVRRLGRGLVKLIKFSLASFIGFVVAELILTVGVLTVYGEIRIPGTAYSSPNLLVLNIMAFVLGVSVAFFINERITVNVQKGKSFTTRFLRFQGINGIGNVAIVIVQLILLEEFSISPVVGNVIGAIASYPAVYLLSMRFVWNLRRIVT